MAPLFPLGRLAVSRCAQPGDTGASRTRCPHQNEDQVVEGETWRWRLFGKLSQKIQAQFLASFYVCVCAGVLMCVCVCRMQATRVAHWRSR